MQRTVFFISDGTGITAETLGKSLLSQFDKIAFEYITIPYVTKTKVPAIIEQIQAIYTQTGNRPILFTTLLNPEINTELQTSHGLIINFFQSYLGTLEAELGHKSSHLVGQFHSAKNYDRYMLRISAVNYALLSDDGANTKEYANADIILLGVSRSGKTPTSLYLALQFGIFVANYPLTAEDLVSATLPITLAKYHKRLFGLTVAPLRLHQIRKERYPHSHYASYEQCQLEIKQVTTLFQEANIPWLDATSQSIEELASAIVTAKNLKRQL